MRNRTKKHLSVTLLSVLSDLEACPLYSNASSSFLASLNLVRVTAMLDHYCPPDEYCCGKPRTFPFSRRSKIGVRKTPAESDEPRRGKKKRKIKVNVNFEQHPHSNPGEMTKLGTAITTGTAVAVVVYLERSIAELVNILPRSDEN